MSNPEAVLKNASAQLIDHGTLIIVLNHPCFRIPRQTSWGIDVHPGTPSHRLVWDYHYSLSDNSRFLHQSGFSIELLEEWISDKQSVGPAARMENFARAEFPLFLTIVAKKKISRGGRSRTGGLTVPNRALCHLSYTPIVGRQGLEP